jgi:hypothetical protein
MKHIELTQDKVALVDDEDYERVGGVLWHAAYHPNSRGWYAKRIQNIMLHREIMQAPDGVEVDHINGNTLDCRKDNLRLVTRRENSLNRKAVYAASGYRGVYSSGSRWRAIIRTPMGTVHIGTYDTPEEAAIAYDKAAIEHNGDFAMLNFPESAL